MREAETWALYRKKRGSFNVSLRLEEGFANVMAMIHNALSKTPVGADKFMPHVVPPAPQDAADDLASVFGMLRAVAAENNTAKKSGKRNG